MNTTENNKLIAEFLGFKSTGKCIISETGKYYDYHAHPKLSCIKEQEIQIESENGWGLVEQDFLFIEDLKFHSDWNWLMEVVGKLESLDDQINFFISGKNCTIEICDIDFKISTESETTILAVYSAVVKFINWHNLNIDEK